ncbi:GNAT family N-acetyltransferase [Egibacter rhizosphaerae]|uniref:GNAT family N-acetyltransferase n=1 Tax=Egibacter rhizosphaerae TaxID=1670831 RepID=A0A411YLI9_9ACTN|nr:GNAT family N-acetyltransferase [Egibacter rhizosphaerae]
MAPGTLYRLLRLRVDVFVVEQGAAYPELDGRDLEPTAVHCWIERDGEPVAYLRVLDEAGGGSRVGRVVTAPSARGEGLATRLVEHVLERCCTPPVRLGAQSHLAEWYGRFGFVRTGETYEEDGIPHVPMERR